MVDAVVVEGALRRGDAVVTSDAGDIEVLAAARVERLVIVEV